MLRSHELKAVITIILSIALLSSCAFRIGRYNEHGHWVPKYIPLFKYKKFADDTSVANLDTVNVYKLVKYESFNENGENQIPVIRKGSNLAIYIKFFGSNRAMRVVIDRTNDSLNSASLNPTLSSNAPRYYYTNQGIVYIEGLHDANGSGEYFRDAYMISPNADTLVHEYNGLYLNRSTYVKVEIPKNWPTYKPYW